MRVKRFLLTAGCFVLLLTQSLPAWAQINILGDTLDLEGKPANKKADHPVAVTAQIVPAAGNKPALLSITAKIQPGWHIYSLTQKPGGPVKSVITIDTKKSSDVKLLGKFDPNPPPAKSIEPLFNNLEVESHEKEVTWRVPVELAAGVKADKARLSGDISVQACNDKNCLPPQKIPFSVGDGAKPGGDKPSSSINQD